MSDLTFLRPPCRLQIIWNTLGGEPAAYPGHLKRVNEDQLDVQLLGYGLVPFTLRAGERISVHVPVEAGVYEIPSRVISEDLSGDLRLAVTGDAKRLDRRRFPRVPVNMAATTAFVANGSSRPPAPITVRVVELSGGGARLESFQPLTPGQNVQVMVPIPGNPPLFPTGVVLGTTKLRPTRGGSPSARYAIRVRFTSLLPAERRTILRYVAHEREQVPDQP